MAELRSLVSGDNHALERAIPLCLARPVSLATRHRAIELLARIRYEETPNSGVTSHEPTSVSNHSTTCPAPWR
jgi:hypothetical protein